MTYHRVLPRDLFNEANLLKCLGQLVIRIEDLNIPGILVEYDGTTFEVYQNPDCGTTFVANVVLNVHGMGYTLLRPLNSREPWPVFIEDGGSCVQVFNDHGNFTPEMLSFLKG